MIISSLREIKQSLITLIFFIALAPFSQALPRHLGDLSEDGAATVDDVVKHVSHRNGTALLPEDLAAYADVDQDGDVDADDTAIIASAAAGEIELPLTPLITINSTSPENGENEVAITRETIVRLSDSLPAGVSIDETVIFAEFGGNRLNARRQLSEDRRTITLFYAEILPASSRIRVVLDGNTLESDAGFMVDADGDGIAGGQQVIEFDTLGLTVVPGTAVCGRVFASELERGDDGVTTVNTPLEGVTITVDGMEDELLAVTDEFGNFRLDPAPAGQFFVHIDGRTTTRPLPAGAYYPFVGKAWTSAAGQETNIGEVFLPLVTEGTLAEVSDTEDTQINLSPTVLEEFPEFDGVRLTVPGGSLFSDDGTMGGMVGIAPVPPDRLPGELPDELDFPLVITVQTDGATNFDEPAPICFPNLPHPETGAVLQPGEKSALWSFNHDTGRFEIAGPMTVTPDGQFICSDPGVGVLAPGWHGVNPGVTVIDGKIVIIDPETGELIIVEPPTGQPGDATDPVYLFSGEFYENMEDLRIKGRGTDFVWTRKYRSKIGPKTVQGNHWDFSYNMFLIPQGDDLLICNGNSRADRYERQPDGTWGRKEFFRTLSQNPDGSFTLTFENTGRWTFRPIDGTPSEGKITSISDRNNNTLRFAYDGVGRLNVITDTLDRDITVSYNAQGFIQAITDFTGRSVRYDYYNGVEPGGMAGDLKSVTTPVITGTPNGNDFPQGKTRTYTYTTGFADERLNSNILSITDGRRNDPNDSTFGVGPYLVNLYSSTTDPEDPLFDRVVRQTWGGDIIDISYVSLIPSKANGEASLQVILNDRNGNVKEHFYDSRNRMVRVREFTGRANKVQPTTQRNNRPNNKLRTSDPDFFETIYQYNDDSLQKRVIHPNGNITEYVYEGDLNPNVPPHSRGNLRIIRNLPGSHSPIGDQQVIEEKFEYDPIFNFVTRHEDARGNFIINEYDERGNKTRFVDKIASVVEEYTYNRFGQVLSGSHPDNGSNHRRRDEFEYYGAGFQRGYLRTEISDAGGAALTETYEYDALGNLVRSTDGRGNTSEFIYNEQDQVVREVSPEVTTGSGIRYGKDIFYDANNNVVRIDIENIDAEGNFGANTHFTTTFDHEILNKIVREVREVDESKDIVTEFEYDSNRNQVLRRHGEATNGNQPDNVVRSLFDERDLRLQDIRGPGTPGQTSSQFDYDRNGNIVKVSDGLEDTPRIIVTTYDAYNRPVRITDSLGNEQLVSYDPNGNRNRIQLLGAPENDLPGSDENIVLSDGAFTFDELNRPIQTEYLFFDTATGINIADGLATQTIEYTDNSQFARITDDNGHSETYTYDTVNRRATQTDTKGNVTLYTYDRNSNISTITEVDRSDLAEPDEGFLHTFSYDNLDRLSRRIDNVGNIDRFLYDSRHNQVSKIDALENVTTRGFDGLNRPIQVTHLLTDTGRGSGNPTGQITISQTWDDNSRLTSLTDDGGNTLRYRYDALDRRITTIHADGTLYTTSYDVHDNVIQSADANGTIIDFQYDLLNRLVRKDISPGVGISDNTTFETFRYDGVSRTTQVADDDSIVTYQYDSLSHELEETLNGEKTVSTFDALSNRLSCTYPGGRVINCSFDELNRKKIITSEDLNLAQYDYVGKRVRRRDYGNNTRLDYQYDDARRITGTTHTLNPTTTANLFDNRAYTWDKVYNKISRRDLLPGGNTHTYQPDSVYRYARFQNSSAPTDTNYTYDGVGNRTQVTGGSAPGNYALASTSPPSDAQANQYTSTPFDTRQYDANGNLIGRLTGARLESYLYDYRNRMVEHIDPDSGVITTYAYDAMSRRIRKTQGTSTTLFFYEGNRVIEEHDGSGSTTATYVYGRFLDEVLSMRREGQDFFYHTDDLFNVTRITDQTGAVVESYRYGDFGEPTILNDVGTVVSTSIVHNPYFFNGRRYDDETRFYYYRTRYLDPEAGRFTTRDTIGIWGDPQEMGNGYTFAGNNPWTYMDPYGRGVLSMMAGGSYSDSDWALVKELPGAFVETAPGSVSILTNTFTFGGSDYVGLTNSNQYDSPIYDGARVAAVISREALITAVTMGSAQIARGGACAIEGTSWSVRAINAARASPRLKRLAQMAAAAFETYDMANSAMALSQSMRKILNGNGTMGDYLALVEAIGGAARSGHSRATRNRDGPYCFEEGTPVLTPEGTIPIEDLNIGDTVLSYDFENGEVVEREIIETPRGETIYWLDVNVGSETIGTTRFHRFWVESEQEWIEAIDLMPGMMIRLSTGELRKVESTDIRVLNRPAKTFNLVVAEHHNYFVGHSLFVLVHNGDKFEGTKKPLAEWLKDYPDLLQELRDENSANPAWQGIDPDNDDVYYRTQDEVKSIRNKKGESGGHHPHGLALGGEKGQDLTTTGDTKKKVNKKHSKTTGLHRKAINRIKKQTPGC